MASQDWPEVTKYAGLVSAQTHRQELIQDLFKTWQDPAKGTMSGGMIKYGSSSSFGYLVVPDLIYCCCCYFFPIFFLTKLASCFICICFWIQGTAHIFP